MLVHIAADRDVPAIRRAGLKIPKSRLGIYAMPVLPNYVVSHQWIRELRSRGFGRVSGVHFRIPDSEPVLIGHFNSEAVEVAAAEAARAVLEAPEPLGLQIIVRRRILPKEIHAVRAVPQVVGWRHFPGAHGQKPCGCPACQRRGSAFTRRIRDQFEAEERAWAARYDNLPQDPTVL